MRTLWRWRTRQGWRYKLRDWGIGKSAKSRRRDCGGVKVVKQAAVVSLLALLCLSCTRHREAASTTSSSSEPSFSAFADEYLRGYYAFAPSEGTSAGFHTYDTKLEDF